VRAGRRINPSARPPFLPFPHVGHSEAFLARSRQTRPDLCTTCQPWCSPVLGLSRLVQVDGRDAGARRAFEELAGLRTREPGDSTAITAPGKNDHNNRRPRRSLGGSTRPLGRGSAGRRRWRPMQAVGGSALRGRRRGGQRSPPVVLSLPRIPSRNRAGQPGAGR